MKRIKMVIELEYDDELHHSCDGDKESKDWFYEEVLEINNSSLLLLSNEIGIEVGFVNVLWAER